MALERTFSIFKPDATARNLTGAINAMIEQAGLRIVAQKRVRISLPQARKFYAVHKERPFFGELVDFMVSGPVVVQVLRGRQRHRQIPRADGRHRPGQGRARHHPQGARQIDRQKFRARFRRPRHGGARDRAVLFRERDRRLARSRASGDRVHSLAQMLDPAAWAAMLSSGWGELGQAEFWLAVGKIIWINILLSGDNAVVIAMACRGLPPRQRVWGMILGAGVAVVLRIVFTGVVASLMLLPYLKIAGGLALFYIAAKLLVPDDPDESETEAVEHLWRAVRIVAIADIIMSLDNVIAIAAAAGGNMALLVLGLAISIPLIVAGAALIMALLDRFPILVWAGAALLGWIVGEVIATDPVVAGYLITHTAPRLRIRSNMRAAAAGAVLVLIVGGLWRREQGRRQQRSLAKPAIMGRDESGGQALRCQADRLFRLPARLPVDLRARSRADRRTHHRPRARRQGQRLHRRRDLRQGRALCRARASQRPAAASAAAHRRQRLRASSRRSPGTTRSIWSPKNFCKPSSATARNPSGLTTMPAPWAW